MGLGHRTVASAACGCRLVMTDSDGAGPGPVPAHCPSIKPGGREWLWPAAGVVQAEDHHDGTVTLQVTQAAGRSRRRPGRRARGSAAPPMSRPGPCRPSIAWLPSVQAPPVDHRTSRPATPGRANLRPAPVRPGPRPRHDGRTTSHRRVCFGRCPIQRQVWLP